MKGDKWRSRRETNEGPEWRSGRGTNEGGQGGSGSQEQPRMEIMKGDDHLAILGISNPVIEK